MKDNEFKNDPLFNALKNFAGAPNEKSALPTEISEAFNSGRKKARVKKYTLRSAFSALVLAITLPALASANVLPDSVKEFVQKVQKFAAAPVKDLIANVQNNDDDEAAAENEDSQEETNSPFPVVKEEKAEIKEAKEEAKESKEVQKELVQNVKERAKSEKEAEKSVKEDPKESEKVDKEKVKEVKNNKGQSKK